MILDALDVGAAWVALLMSGASTIWFLWSKFKDGTDEKIEDIRLELTDMRSFRDRLSGASLLTRVVELESRQRDAETAMARVEQKLSSMDDLLNQINTNIQNLARTKNE